jgi:hypothetical protein
MPTDEDRQRTDRRRGEPGEAPSDAVEVGVEVADPGAAGAVGVLVLLVVAGAPTGAEAEHEAATAEVVDGARHVGDQVRVAEARAPDEVTELDT